MEQKVILVVDDEHSSREFIKTVVEERNIKVITANDGVECLSKAKEEIPDLIILDIQMPKKDGLTSFAELKKEPITTNIPVFMLTGIEDKRDISFSKKEMGELYGTEPDEYIEKPIDPEKLLKLIQAILD